MKPLKKVITICLSTILSFATLLVVANPINASEQDLIVKNEVVVHDNYSQSMRKAYSLDEFGNLISDNSNVKIEAVEVVYDGAWYGLRAANVPRVINVTVSCIGTGIFSDPMYTCRLSVAITLYYNSSTMLITSLGTLDVYQYSAPGTPQAASSPRATASITNSGKSVRIRGYINYSAAGMSQTFTGSTKYYL